jgi:hypothetical protein
MSQETSLTALFAEQIQELLDRLAVPARTGPHEPAGVMVHDNGEVSLPLADRDLIHPDPLQAREQVAGGELLIGHPGADPADRSPRDPHQLRDRGLGGLHRQPRDLILELAGEHGVVSGPRDRRHNHAVTLAAHSGRVGLEIRERRPEVQRPPAPPAVAEVVARAAPPAVRTAIELAGDRPDRHHQHSTVGELDVLDDSSVQTKQLLPYASSAHAPTAPFTSVPDLKKPEP